MGYYRQCSVVPVFKFPEYLTDAVSPAAIILQANIPVL